MLKIKGMKISPDWATAIGTWVTIVLIIVSIILVWIQINDLRKSVQNQTYQSVYETEFDLFKYLLDHPEDKPYFYDNKHFAPTGNPEADKKERDRLNTLAEWWCDFFDDVHQQKSTMKESTFEKWRQFMKDIYATSPLLREHIERRGTAWYPKEYIEDIKCPHLEKCPKP
jgi:hypothetical protein